MKKSFHVFFLFVLFVLVAATTTNAVEVMLQDDGNGGYKIELPCDQTGELMVPSDVSSFKVYRTTSCAATEPSALNIIAPEGKGLQLSGTVDISDYPDANYVQFLDLQSGTILGEDRYLREGDYKKRKTGTLVPLSGQMQLKYVIRRKNCSGCSYEVDATVFVFDKQPVQQTVHQAENGLIALDNETPNAGTLVSVTATPNEGFVLNGLNI